MQQPPISAAQKRFEPERSATWPPAAAPSLRVEAVKDDIQIPYTAPQPKMAPLTRPTKPASDPLFEDELNRHPEDHFLSPVQMYEFENWAEDSDDDDEEFVEWDAGITDFALFNDERRRAAERNEDVPDRWQDFVASQASALQRAVERNRADSDSRRQSWIPLHDDLPQLTPDNSPDLRGDFDIHAYCGQKMPQGSFPHLKVTPPEDHDEEDDDDDSYDFDDDDDEDSDEDDLPVAYLVERARERRRQARQLEKPGMRFTRTLSGKVHVWRRPSLQIYDVDEDAEAESRAERLHEQGEHTITKSRGRQR